MSDSYKLVFRGEVLEGQHPAVVRKRLGQAAGFADGQLDKLFSGKPVVVKRDADSATAARFQAVFRKAGARLRVLPVETAAPVTGTEGTEGAAAATPAPVPESGGAAAAAAYAGAFELRPAGSDLLDDHERAAIETREVDTSALTLEGARFALPDASPEPLPAAPDVSHLTLADPGTDLGRPAHRGAARVAAPELGIADVGADLGSGRQPAVAPIDIEQVNFEIAPAGSDLSPRRARAAPPPPDTSHLTLK